MERGNWHGTTDLPCTFYKNDLVSHMIILSANYKVKEYSLFTLCFLYKSSNLPVVCSSALQ